MLHPAKAAIKAGIAWGLLCGIALVFYTSALNRFDRVIDVALLWVYVQGPLLAGGIVGALLINLLVAAAERFRQPKNSNHRFIPVFAGLAGITGSFIALSTVRADYWYTRTYPWVGSWGQMLLVVALSLVAVAAIGILVFVVTTKIVAQLHRTFPTFPSRAFIVGFAGGLTLLTIGITMNAERRNQVPPQPDELPARTISCDRLVLVGIDGMVPEIVDTMMASGELPTFRDMAENGYYGELTSTKPTNSPVIWTTIATGRNRYDHGVMNFLVQHPKGLKSPIRTFPSHMGLNTTFLMRRIYTDRLVATFPVPGSFRRAATLWEIASSYGLRCGVVNWWPSWPAREINGFIISDSLNEHVSLLNKRDSAIGGGDASDAADYRGFSSTSEVTWPPELADEIRVRVEREQWESADDPHLMEIGLELYERFDPELFMIYLHGPDMPQHLYWDAFEPNLYRDVATEYVSQHRNAIPDAYRTADRLVGDLRSQLGENATVIVVSDHGASPVFSLLSFWGYRAGHEHGPPGVIFADGPAIRRITSPVNATVFDIAPTMLALLGISPSVSMNGIVLEEILDGSFSPPPDRSVPSWDFLSHQRVVAPPVDVAEEKEDALRALGYIN